MEIDLEQVGNDSDALAARLRSQICVVGGGIAGLILAHRLMLGGVRVTLLEAGGRAARGTDGRDPFLAKLQGVPHRGMVEGRVCALGGCSLTWGGQLLPLPEDAPWPVPLGELRYQEAAWGMPYDTAQFFAANRVALPPLLEQLPELTPRLSRFLAFSRRNLAETLGKRLRGSRGVQVVLHGAVTELALSPEGERVTAAVVRLRSGKLLRVAAEVFVVAAGTVETCRLLLASRSVAETGVGNGFGQVGLHFHDHLTVAAATFTGAARARMLAEFGPWVLAPRRGRRGVYSMKLEPSASLREELGLHPAMAHLTVEEPEGSGAGVLRELLRSRQVNGAGRALREAVGRTPRLVLDALRFGWHARVKHRRYVSEEATVRLQLNVAQDAPSASRVFLGENCDPNGMPQAIVDWRISAAELASLRRLAGYLRERMESAGIRDDVAWEPALFADGAKVDGELIGRLDDARHAMGGARMGTDPRESVVDPDLKVHGVENLYLASAAVFPDGSAQLPTLTLSALCARLAERLVAGLGPRR